MKSVEVKFNEAVASLTKANLLPKFNKKFSNLSAASIEVKLNAALEALKDEGIVETFTEAGVWELNFAAKRHIRKNNGSVIVTESDRSMAEVNSKKEKQVASVMKSCNLTEAGARNFLGLKAKTPEGLNARQASEYSFARRCGMSESDAMVLAKMPFKG